MIHGQGKKKLSWDELRVFDVVLTTYGTLGAEYKRLEAWLNQQRLAGHPHDYDQVPMNKLFPVLGAKSVFYRVILDEAQNIKNKNTNASRAAKVVRSKTRFCLTGTPMMNNVGELYSLIHFLRIRPYNEWTRFQDVSTLSHCSEMNANIIRPLES
jgi:SNF2 family DNA or RNA helicase